MRLFEKVLITIGSIITIGFGLWHFFVPKIWSWYSYIKEGAAELVLAVRAINVFFSLCLVLFGAIHLVFAYSGRSNRFSVLVLLGATCILWLIRVIMQLIYPQGSAGPALQYGMTASFVFTLLCFLIAFVSVLRAGGE